MYNSILIDLPAAKLGDEIASHVPTQACAEDRIRRSPGAGRAVFPYRLFEKDHFMWKINNEKEIPMDILVLQGSPRPKGNTAQMVEAFRRGARSAGHSVEIINVFEKRIGDCRACEYCHTVGNGKCIQDDEMQEIYPLLMNCEMLVLASPIYYHGISGQLKCAIDRFYSCAYPTRPEKLRKAAMLLNSGAPDVYEGAIYSFKNDFIRFLGLQDLGVFTACGPLPNSRLQELERFGADLK